MELPQRHGADRFLPVGRYRSLEQTLAGHRGLRDVRTLIVSALDRSTRMMPFVNIDRRLVPCGPRSIAGSLYASGLEKTRFVFQLWNPNIRPSRAQIDGAPIDMLMVSSLQVHSAAAYRLIEEAWTAGDHRPLIIAGGPKACYEPFDFFGLGDRKHIGADIVVTGEEAVLMELLTVLADFGGGPGTMRQAFVRARGSGALQEVPGLVYPLDDRHDGMNLHNTGVQRLLCDLDELPLPTAGFRTLEAPHRRPTLRARPIPLNKACRGTYLAAILVTRGCKFHCHYCPIPAYNQKTFRRKSPERMIEEFIDCRRHMDTRYFFGADDNFFNSRRYVSSLLEAMASTRFNGKALGRQVRFATEATVIDLYKNRDLLPLATHGRAGMNAIWLGVEDLAANLIDKGQTADIVKELFAAMLANDISPMVMLMHHEGQPFYTVGRLDGLLNQVEFVRKAGAAGLQCTVANPLHGSRWMTESVEKRLAFADVGGRKVVDSDFDGNHVICGIGDDGWKRQVNLLRAYAAFYNPINLFRMLTVRKKALARKRMAQQIWGMTAWVRTAWKLKGHLWRLWRGPVARVRGWPEAFRRSGSPYVDLIKSPADRPDPTLAVPASAASETIHAGSDAS